MKKTIPLLLGLLGLALATTVYFRMNTKQVHPATTEGSSQTIASGTSVATTTAHTSTTSPLDADGNGLYDDTERKLLLDTLLQAVPELSTLAAPLPFDADGDGKVSILEQSQGRHPLTMLIPPHSLAEAGVRIPWAIDAFPEWITSAWLQEDIAEGTVAKHVARGTQPSQATQSTEALHPHKNANRGGVEFAANSGQNLSMPGYEDAGWSYRWCVFTFRIDATSGSNSEATLLNLNQYGSTTDSLLKIWYNKTTGLSVRYIGKNKSIPDRRVMTSQAVVADGQTWNVVVCGIRSGQMFASLNGVALSTDKPQPDHFSINRTSGLTSTIGDRFDGNMAWAYDALVFGLTEPSEAMVSKLTGWAAHRLDIQNRLPVDHPYRSARPIVDAEDFPHRYFPDDEKWTAWGQSLTDKSFTRSNAGGPRATPQGFERVFIDDFRASRLADSSSGEGDLWQGYGFNSAVGGAAPLVRPGEQPDAYSYDAENKLQTLSLVKQGNRWRGSALYTVNDLGHGYTWSGAKIFRIRCMFPAVPQAELTRGLFPAFWSYDPGFLFWRTGNRIELDWWEFDGKSGSWLNGLASHTHYSHFRKNIFAKNPDSYKSYKGYGGRLSEESSKIPGGLYVWDGQYHTWEYVVDNDITYINVTIPDPDSPTKEKWVEIARVPTAPTYLENLDIQIDYALKSDGSPKDDQRQDFTIDWIDVWQKTSAVESAPAPFVTRPQLTGSNKQGATVTCDPKLNGITDVRYYWFADDYPLTYGPSPSYVITAADAGKAIRCMVKAVGARDTPEAWSNTIQ